MDGEIGDEPHGLVGGDGEVLLEARAGEYARDLSSRSGEVIGSKSPSVVVRMAPG